MNVYVFFARVEIFRGLFLRELSALRKSDLSQIIENFKIVRLTSNFLTMLKRVLVTPEISGNFENLDLQ